MSVDFKKSQTMRNLMKAFAGESQARNRYTIAAQQAGQQKLYVVERIFNFTADQEKEHAEVFYKQLTELAGETIQIDGGYPVDISQNMSDLLRMAQHNEYEEHDDVYSHFEQTAREEGFQAAASRFHLIAKVEKIHGDRFGELAKLLENNELFVSKVETKWMCLKCGHTLDAKEAPEKCPVCESEQGWFIRMELAPYTKDGAL